MAAKKDKRLTAQNITKEKKDDARKKINAALDDLILAALQEPQLDSFYENKATEIKALDEDSSSYVSKRFIKAEPREKEILLQFFKQWQGIEHITFLQEFVSKETFWPLIGALILDLFNRCDAMVEAGLASRLLELDSLAQRLKQHIANRDSMDDSAAESTFYEFLERDEKEKEGILAQLLDEVGVAVAPLMLKTFEKDDTFSKRLLELVGACATEDSLEILSYLYDKTKKKEIIKVIKKLTHLLRLKGFDVSTFEPEEKPEAIFKKISLPEPSAYVSSIDGIGDRIMFMIRPMTTFEYKLFQIYFNDIHGVKELSPFNILKKESQTLIEKLQKEEHIHFLEVPPDYACFLVEESYSINQKEGHVAAGSVSQWRSVFANILNVRKQPVIYDYLNKEKIQLQSYLLNNTAEIFEKKEILFWFIGSNEAKDQWMKVKEAMYSPLVLNNYQKEDRFKEIYENTVELFFNEQQKFVFQRRLEDIAYFFYREGSEDKASIALACALSLSSQDIPIRKNPFCISLIKEGFKFFESGSSVSEEQNSIIVDPKDFSLMA
jgi:hypothetical protein